MSSDSEELRSSCQQGSGDRPTLRQQGGVVVGGLRDAALHFVRHVESLCELFLLETQDYARRQRNYALGLALGLGFVGCAYLFLCVLAIVLLAPLLTEVWAVAAVVLFNLLAGLITLLVAGHSQPGKLAPDTVREIKNDIECAKLYLNAKGKR